MRKIIFDLDNINKSDSIDESKSTISQEKSNIDEMYKYIDKVMKDQKGKIGLGVHALRKENRRDKSEDEVLREICDNGLDIRKGSSVLATVSSLGISSELKNYQKEALRDYKVGSEMAKNGVVVLVPIVLEGREEKLYVGFPGMDTSTVGNNHRTTCILDKLCCGDHDYGQLPKEFILGHFKEENGERIFQKNRHHFLEMTEEEKETFIKSLSGKLTEQQRQISEAVINKDRQSLEELSVKMCGNRDGVLGENTMIQNAMFYLNRELGQVEQNGDNVKEDSRKSKRKILLEVCQDVKLSDLTNAKGILRDGIEQPEKNYEGKEI